MFFTFSFLFWLLTTLLFASGATIQKLYCETLEEPEDSELYRFFEEDLNQVLGQALNNTGFQDTEWIVSDMIDNCEDGKSLYQILHLEQAFDVDLIRTWRAYVDTEGTAQPYYLQTITDGLNMTMLMKTEQLTLNFYSVHSHS